MMDEHADDRLVERWGGLNRCWGRVLAAGVACAAGALIVSLFLPKVYRATTYVLVSESRLGQSSDDTNLQQMAMLPTFVPFVDNDALIDESLKTLGLDQPPYSLTVNLFRRGNYLDVRTPRSTRLLELQVEFPDPDLAADLANEIATGAVRFNDQLNATDTTATREFLKVQLDQALAVQSHAASRRLKVLEAAGIEDQETELSILLAEKEGLSVRLGQLRLDLVQNQSRAESLEQILASEPELISLRKEVTSDRVLELAAEAVFPTGTPLSVTEESINETREVIRESLIDATVARTAQSAEIEAASARLSRVNEEVSSMVARITQSRAGIEAANQDFELAIEATRSASRQYQSASVTVGAKTQDMKQIAPALAPERPVRPQVVVNMVVGFFLGAVLAGGTIVAIRSYGQSRAAASSR